MFSRDLKSWERHSCYQDFRPFALKSFVAFLHTLAVYLKPVNRSLFKTLANGRTSYISHFWRFCIPWIKFKKNHAICSIYSLFLQITVASILLQDQPSFTLPSLQFIACILITYTEVFGNLAWKRDLFTNVSMECTYDILGIIVRLLDVNTIVSQSSRKILHSQYSFTILSKWKRFNPMIHTIHHVGVYLPRLSISWLSNFAKLKSVCSYISDKLLSS